MDKTFIVTNQMKATEQYFSVVLFVVLYKVALSFESVDKILYCNHANEGPGGKRAQLTFFD